MSKFAIAAGLLMLASSACSGGGEGAPEPSATASPVANFEAVAVTSAATSTPPVTPSPTATRTVHPTVTATPSATPAATQSQDGESPFLVPVADGLVRRAIALDAAPSESHGVIFVDLESGGAELWTTTKRGYGVYQVDPNGRWIFVQTYVGEPSAYLADRQSGRTYGVFAGPIGGLRADGLYLTGSDDSFAIFNLASEPPGSRVAGFTLPATEALNTNVVPLAESRVLIRGGDARYVVDLETGEWWEADSAGAPEAHPATDEIALVLTSLERGEDGSRLHVTWIDAWGRGLAQHTVLDQEPWAGPYAGFSLASPDGRWVAWQSELPLGTRFGQVGAQHWPTVTLASVESGEVRMRAVRASMFGGHHPLQWLSDSSALLVSTPHGYAMLRTDGTLSPLLLGPVDRGSVGRRLPVPAPGDPRLLVFGGRVVDLEGNALSPAVGFGYGGPPAVVEQTLSADGSELRIVRDDPLAIGGHSAGATDLGPGLGAKVETVPFLETVQLRVPSNGQQIKVHVRSDSGSPVVGQLSGGALVRVTTGPSTTNCEPYDGCSVDAAADGDSSSTEEWWVHVTTDDGLEGWVRPERLEWAD